MTKTKTKHVRLLLAAGALGALLAFGRPWLDLGRYALRLYAMPVPATLPKPVGGATRRALTDTWHAARAPGRRHEGIDIFAPKGTPVLSATEGIVLRRGWNTLGGKAVWVLGPGGQRHYYAHLDGYGGAGAFERVAAGGLLGYVGNTGNARTTPPHLHYGVYGAEGAINPYPLLAARGRAGAPPGAK